MVCGKMKGNDWKMKIEDKQQLKKVMKDAGHDK